MTRATWLVTACAIVFVLQCWTTTGHLPQERKFTQPTPRKSFSYSKSRHPIEINPTKMGPKNADVKQQTKIVEPNRSKITSAFLSTKPNRVAVFTIVCNEPFFLPIWLQYYGKHFASKDMYVIDNGSTDGSTRSIKAQVVRQPSKYFNDLDWLRRTVTTFQTQLLRSGYDYVLFAEVDEIVVSTHPSGLAKHLAGYTEDSASMTGYDVVHDIFNEPDLQPDLPIMRQRHHAVRAPWWDKPLLTSVPIVYCKGFHVCVNDCHAPKDDSLLLFHLHRADFKTCYDRLNTKAARQDFNPNEEKNQGVQQHYQGRMAAAHCLNSTLRTFTTFDHVSIAKLTNNYVSF